jgi:hypothetical protein
VSDIMPLFTKDGMGFFEQYREFCDCLHDPEYRLQVQQFRRLCKRMNSSDVQLADCIDMFAHRTIDGFYGPKNSGLKNQWLTHLKRFLADPHAETNNTVPMIAHSLVIRDQVEMISTLYESFCKEDTQWVTTIFNALTEYHRVNAEGSEDFEDFRRGVSMSNFFPSNVVSSCLPEVRAEKLRREASIPAELRRLNVVFKTHDMAQME